MSEVCGLRQTTNKINDLDIDPPNKTNICLTILRTVRIGVKHLKDYSSGVSRTKMQLGKEAADWPKGFFANNRS